MSLRECPYCGHSLTVSPFWYIVAFLLFSAFILTGCGSPSAPTSPDLPPVGLSSPNGLFVVSGQSSASSGAIAEQRWAEVQACAGSQVSIRGISLVLEPFTVDANGAAAVSSPWGPTGGYFVTADASVHVVGSDAWSVTWRHELLHLFLNRTTGDADINHNSPLFKECGQ